MSTPNLRFMNRLPITPGQVAFRQICVIFALINPLIAIFTLVSVLVWRIFAHKRPIGPVLILAGVILSGLSVILGYHKDYLNAYITTFTLIGEHGLRDFEGIFQALYRNLGVLFFMQSRFAFSLSLILTGAYVTFRNRYADTWSSSSEKQPKKISARTIQRAKDKQNTHIASTAQAPSINALTIPIGISAEDSSFYELPATAFRTHTVIFGPTGLGKTQLLQRLLYSFCAAPQAAHLKIPALIIDMKADPELTNFARTIADNTGRKFHHITTNPAETTAYNPIGELDADQIADSLYETLYANDPTLNTHYATLARRLLQNSSHALCDLVDMHALKPNTHRTWQRTLSDLTELLNLRELGKTIPDLSPHIAKQIANYLDDMRLKSTLEIGDIKDRLATIIDTYAGQAISNEGLSLEQAITNGDIVCMSLDAAQTPETARAIGRLAIQDANATLARLFAKGWSKHHICPIVLDEFGALQSAKVADLYARARSAGAALILTGQDAQADLNSVNENFAHIVQTNANIWFILRQTRAGAAEQISRDIGSHSKWKETIQTNDTWDPLGGIHAASGVSSLREVEEFIIHPNQLKNLPQGSAYAVIKTTPGSLNTAEHPTHITKIHINAPTLITHPTFMQSRTPLTHHTTTHNEPPTPLTTSNEPWPQEDEEHLSPPF